MQYLIVDPIGSYAAYIKDFLDRLGMSAVAILSSEARQRAWHNKWRHRLGEHVVGDYLADDDTDLRQLAKRIAKAHPGGFAGIVPWDEMSVVNAAELAEHLDLGWNPPKVMERCRDKFVMKQWLRQQGGVRINASRVVSSAEDAIDFQRQLDRWPIVVKPSGGAGAMGVYFADDVGQLLGACQRVLGEGLGEVLLEEFIGGPEFAINGMVDTDGSFLVTDIWSYEKRDSHGQTNLYYQSIRMSTRNPLFWDLARYAADVIDALELRRAPVHMEVKVDDRGPCLIEVGARLAGGDQPVLASKLHGRSLFELAACHYLADLPLTVSEVDFARYESLHARIVSGIQPFEIPRVEEVHGVDEVEQLPSFAGFGFLWPPGMRLPVTSDLNTKAYEIYLLHPDPRQVAVDAMHIRRLIRYT